MFMRPPIQNSMVSMEISLGTTDAKAFGIEVNRWIFMIPVKIQCGCGQRYAFDIEPVCGRMPRSVACPVCGADGTGAANEVIAFNLATELSTHNSSREGVMLLAVIGCLTAGIVGVIKATTMARGLDVLLCLWGAVLAFGVAMGVYFSKRAGHVTRLAEKGTPRSTRGTPICRSVRVWS
jgi:hypothetical protein